MELVKFLSEGLGGPEAFWLIVTHLGRDEVFIVVLALYAWLANPRGARALGVAFAASYLSNTLLKLTLDLPRPFHLDPALASEAARSTAPGPGLPSGHTQMVATVWLGMASQLRRRAFLGAALVLVTMVSLSRLVLGVHFPSDVVVGLAVGIAFAWLATRPIPRLAWAAGLVLALAFVPALDAYARGLAMLAAFLFARLDYAPPARWREQLLVGAGGLLIVFGVYFGFRVLPDALRHSGPISAVRIVATILAATEMVPFLFRRWMPPRAMPTPDGDGRETAGGIRPMSPR